MDWIDKTRLLEGTMVGIILGIVFLCLIVSLTGCSTTKPCAPCPPPAEAAVIHDQVRSCPDPGTFPPVILPAAEPFPESGGFEAIRSWLADLRELISAREAILTEAIASRDRVLDEYRER